MSASPEVNQKRRERYAQQALDPEYRKQRNSTRSYGAEYQKWKVRNAQQISDPEYKGELNRKRREWYSLRVDHFRGKCRESYARRMSNPDSKKNQQKRVSNYGKQYRKSHQDSISQYKKNWYRKRYDSDPEFRRRFLAAVNRRRAARVSATINPQSITIFIEGVKSKQFATCYYCKRRISTKRIHIDHILALSKGGSHSVENLCVSCPECNWSKNDRLLKDFVTLGQQLLEL